MANPNRFAQWYAMRSRLKKEGKWTGKMLSVRDILDNPVGGPPAPKILKRTFGTVAEDSSPEDIVPGSQERVVPDSNPSTPSDLPPLEDPPTEEGRNERREWVLRPGMGQI